MPAPRTTPESLIDLIIKADAIRRRAMGMAPARYKPHQRRWIEPWFNVLGMLFGRAQGLVPWRWRRRLDLWMCRKMAGHAPEENPELEPRIAETVALARWLQRETSAWPATLVLTSHPETMGSLQWLRFELLRQGLQVADAVVDARLKPIEEISETRPNKRDGNIRRPILSSRFSALTSRHPQCFLAIDPYALDTVTPSVGGFYAAWMHHVYMAWDRQPSTQSWIQKSILLRDSGYARVIWRLIDRLKRDIPVLMMLPGGLPHNARMLYGAREFVHRLPVSRWLFSKRDAEKRIMEILMEPVDGVRPAEGGDLPPPTEKALRQFLASCNLTAAQVNQAFEEFKIEFSLTVPYRARFFNVLNRRLVARGKPLILVAMTHGAVSPHIRVAEPWGLFRSANGTLCVRRGQTVEPLENSLALGQQFAKLYQ